MSNPSSLGGPKPTDVILRMSLHGGLELVDAATHKVLARGLPSIAAAVEAARVHGAGEIWQQHVDNRGRPLGDPFRLLRQFPPEA